MNHISGKYKTIESDRTIRVIVSGMHFITKVNQIREADKAIRYALDELDRLRESDPAVGIAGIWFGHSVQVDLM